MVSSNEENNHSTQYIALAFLRRVFSLFRTKFVRLLLLTLVITLVFVRPFVRWDSASISQDISSSSSKSSNNTTTLSTTTTVRPIINPYPFNYTILTEPCTDEDLLIVVHSAVQYHKRRMVMRDTWLNKAELERGLEMKVKMIFVTGATNDTSVQNYILYEDELYHDILQSNFIDHYQNNTYKALSYIRWATSKQGCPDVKLILKVDDDALLHPVKIPLLNQTIYRLLHNSNSTDIYSGKLLTLAVNRQHASKWYMSPEIWPDKYYPTWFQGLAYMITPSLAAKLPSIALYTTYLFTDDVYVGILVSKVPEANVVKDNQIGAGADNPQTLLKEFVNGSHVFYHVPFYDCYYVWYQRTDVIIKQPPPPKQKTSVATILLIVFSPFILLLFFCIAAILYFNYFEEPQVDTKKTAKSSKSAIKAQP